MAGHSSSSNEEYVAWHSATYASCSSRVPFAMNWMSPPAAKILSTELATTTARVSAGTERTASRISWRNSPEKALTGG